MELKLNNEYIIKKTTGLGSEVLKIRVTELTKQSLLFYNVDKKTSSRMLITDFKYNYSIIEDLGFTEETNDKFDRIFDKFDDIFDKFDIDAVFKNIDLKDIRDKFKNQK